MSIKDKIIANANELVKTCDLIADRVVDAYVLAMPDGQVLMTYGIGPFPFAFGDKVGRFKTKVGAEAALSNVRKLNPDNESVQQLEITTLRKAARKQRQTALAMLELAERMKANA